MKIYTKTGDTGETSLLGGARVLKSSIRIQAYGEVDELNSVLGVVIAHIKNNKENLTVIEDSLIEIQGILFHLGANLACDANKRSTFKLKPIEGEMVSRLEKIIDELESELPELKNFILPGGSLTGSYLQLARTVCRRVERVLVDYLHVSGQNEVPDNSVKFMNRLSDLLFVMARYANNHLCVDEVIWKG